MSPGFQTSGDRSPGSVNGEQQAGFARVISDFATCTRPAIPHYGD
jgi:hypothetical protein